MTVTGVVFRPQLPPETLREVALAVEEAGVAELWLWEDCFLEGGLTAATAALAWTDRLRVGIGLLPVPLRNPALAAMEIATTARLFPDRLIVTLGHGVLDWMAQVGARAESPMTLLREHTSAVRALLHGETIDVDDRYVHLDRVALDWPPAASPTLLIGARGPRTVALAGEVADGVLLDSITDPDVVRRARAAVGPDRQVVAYTEVDPTRTTRAEVAERVAAFGEAGADAVVLHGTAEDPDPRSLLDLL